MTERSIVYHHRQVGHVLLVMLLIAAIVMDVAATTAHAPPVALTIVALTSLLLIAVALLLSSLTVEIDDRELRAYFGPGLTAKRVALADIATVDVMPSSVWSGWGIRLTTRGMLYNVSGKGAVEVTLKSRQRFRIGTDEEAALKAALENSCRRASNSKS